MLKYLKTINFVTKKNGGFDWDESIDRGRFWTEILDNKKFNLFYEKYS